MLLFNILTSSPVSVAVIPELVVESYIIASVLSYIGNVFKFTLNEKLLPNLYSVDFVFLWLLI